MNRQNRSRFNLLSLKLTIYIIITGLVFSLISSTIQLAIEYNRGLANVESTKRIIQNSYLDSISNSVFHFNEELLKVQINGLLHLDSVVYIVLEEVKGEEITLFESGNPSADRSFSAEYPLLFDIEDSETFKLGTLKVYLNLESYFMEMKNRIMPLLVERIALIMMISFVIYLITHRMITRHLSKIAQFTNSFKPDQLSHSIKLDRKTAGFFRPDEFDFLEEALNTMSIRLIEDQLEKNRMISAINQSNDSIIVMNDLGIIQFSNPIFTELTGIKDSELLEHSFMEIWDSIESNPVKEVENAIRTGQNWTGRLQMKGRTGNIILEDVSISAVKHANSAVSNCIAVMRDVSRRELLEKEKRSLQEQYYHIQKVESLGRLTGGIAHDLNNLMTPVLGFSDLLRNRLNESDYAMPISEIYKAALRASELINQLLTFSRKQTQNTVRINLNTIIRDFEQLIRGSVREDIRISIKLARDMKDIFVDKGQIEQVLMNMTINARDAMPDGGELTIQTKMLSPTEAQIATAGELKQIHYAAVSITDNGMGMDRETRNKIFDPFFSTKGELGTGLGLATSFGIIKQHNGLITVQSEPGTGSTFTILLPVIELENRKKEKSSEIHRDINNIIKPESILLVEDDISVRNSTETILKRYGFTVVSAGSGREALEILKNNPSRLSLLLTDLIMPEMKGHELCREALKINPVVKILIISGYTGDLIPEAEKIPGHFLQKPFTINQLIDAVNKSLYS